MADPSIPVGVSDYLARRGLARARVEPLAGDASDRRYFRVRPVDAPPFVVALHPAPFADGSLPFVRIAGLFAAAGVPTPRILDEAGALAILALEDLGDTTLEAHISQASEAERDRLYDEALALVVRLQRIPPPPRPDHEPFSLAFDADKLMWELRFFITHFLHGFRGLALPDARRAALEGELQPIVEELAAEPRVVCHRDYHSRNLMVRDGRLVVIDFQDARMGPDTYDLVSLVRDSYVDLPADRVEALVDTFARAIGHRARPDEFRRRFDLMALQRNLKALGTFGYQATARANPAYVRHVPRTLAYVRDGLARHARFAPLRDLLAAHLPELR